MANVQIFGVKNSQATRAAERFFKERGVPFQSVDLKRKPMAPAEIGRFVARFGITALLDAEGKAYVDAGLKYMKVGERELLAKIPRTRRGRVTNRGPHLLGLAVQLYRQTWPELLAA